MGKIVALTILWLITSVACAADLPIVNADFELPASGGIPPGWVLSQHAGKSAYEMEVVSDSRKKGGQSFRMRRISPEVYGIISQDVPIQSRSGQQVALSALMKGQDVGDEGWRLVINFIGKVHPRLPAGILEQVRSEPLMGSSDWKRLQLRAPIPEGTQTLSIGAMLLGDGTGWVDDFRLEVLDAP